MENIIVKLLAFQTPKSIAEELNWLQQSEQTSKQLLTFLLKKNDLTHDELIKVEIVLTEIMNNTLSRPAYNSFGQALYIIKKLLNKNITDQPYLLRGYLSDKQTILKQGDGLFTSSYITNGDYDVLCPYVECLTKTLKNSTMSTEILSESLTVLQSIRNRFILTQNNKEWCVLRDGYLQLIPLLPETNCIDELKEITKISWCCKSKYVMLFAFINKIQFDVLIEIIPDIIQQCVNAVEENTFKSPALLVIKEIVVNNISSLNIVLDLLTPSDVALSIITSIFSIKPNETTINLCAKKQPLITAASLKMIGYEMETIMKYIDIDKILIPTMSNATSKAFHLGIITCLHSDYVKINAHEKEILYGIKALYGLYDCLTDETPVIITLFPRLILRSKLSFASQLFSALLSIIQHPFNEKIDGAILQITTSILQSVKSRKDLNPLIKDYLENSSFQRLLQRSITSRVDRLRALTFTTYSLLLPFTHIHKNFLQTNLQESVNQLTSLRSSEADGIARIFVLLCSFKETPILKQQTITFTGQSKNESIESILIELETLTESIKESNSESYADHSLYGLFRILQLSKEDAKGFEIAIKVVNSSNHLLTLPAPEGTAPSMVVGGWTSIRAAAEIMATSASKNFDLASKTLIYILRTALHRGIFERAAASLETALRFASNEWLAEEVIRVINEIEFESKFTRRSAGLPYHLIALLSEEYRRIRQPTSSPPMLLYSINKLTNCERSWAIHGMNTFAGLMKTQKTASEIDSFFPGLALIQSLTYMDDVDWSLRNSASILASSVVRRLFSTKETFSLHHMTTLIPNAIEHMTYALKNGLNSSTIVAVILARLSFTNTIHKSKEQQLIQDALLCAMKRKLTAPCVEALGVAFTRCIPNSIIDIIVKDLSSVGLFILAEYVKTGSTLSQSQIQQVVSFIPKTSFEADKLFNLLFILNKPLPNLSSLHFQTQDAYTLRCIRLVATYHSKDNINVLLMLKSNDVIVRETALMRCQEHPNGVDAKQFFDITKPLLNEDAPHVLNVLNAMNSIIKENINQNKNVCSFIGDTNSFVDQLQKLVDNEPLVKCSAIAILLYFKPLSMEYISCIGNDQITLETYFMKYLSERKVEVMLNAVATMLEDLEKNITVTLALNSVFKMDFDPQHMLNHLILEIVQLGNKEQIQTLINIVLDIQIFDYLYEITHTTQIFEPELPTFLVDRVELLLLIKKHIADNSYIESIYTNIKTSATRCQTNNSTEYLKQLCESFEKMN